MVDKSAEAITNQDKTDLLEALFKRRDIERERLAKSTKVVDGEKLPLENNRMGLYKWYLHPDKQDVAIRTILLWVQEIPPNSRSGKQKHQGGRVHYVLEGRGYTEIDGVKYEWEKGDMILLPIRPRGVVFQHFNTDPENRARLIAAEPNWFDALGVDLGSGFEQLENSPDYRP
jgi:mannose-6-phosphate isomerase-like protein (cupin superfamily)